ncbi:co-chaperone protein p23-1 isoform X2 [Beta vulgaris subsp. vulgaris]|uniref:co-chaperone protein p23-1 isoform X2 n=1 Tax=Beta vulgaris subsp. vulgaris TaxID=3555 RepID=UPI002036C354|nr:co-chaperone protein p23-1 isoform X2 [Beta vulgaris subsp. vulgaris]
MSRHPSVKWAQSSDKVYVTIELPDAKDVKLKLEPEGKMAFSAVKNAHPYEFDIELLDKINVEESKYNIGVRQIEYVIEKAEKRWWSRLIKQEGNPPIFLKVDWDKWVDENEENKNGSDLGGLSLSSVMQQLMAGDIAGAGCHSSDISDSTDEKDKPKENEETAKNESVAAAEEAKAKEEPIEPVDEKAKAKEEPIEPVDEKAKG